ncbi:MAG: hypothetical protein WCO12_04110 [bacterium]
MKTSFFAVITAIIISISSTAFSQNLIPPLKSNDFTLQISGYGQGLWGDRVLVGNEHNRTAAWQSLVTRFDLKTPTPAVKFYGEVEFWGIDKSNANWLKKAFVEVKASDYLTLRLGRMLLSGGYNTPSSDNLETVHYPRVPFPVYGNGLQAEVNLGEGWTLITDIEGETSSHFDDLKMYQKVEATARLTKSFDEIHLALSGQVALAESFKLYGINADWKPLKELHLKSCVYTADDNVLGYSGGYIFVGYTLFDYTELHNQVDYRTDEHHSSSTIWTKGVRVWCPRDQVELTLDHETVFSKEAKTDNRLFARLQIRF